MPPVDSMMAEGKKNARWSGCEAGADSALTHSDLFQFIIQWFWPQLSYLLSWWIFGKQYKEAEDIFFWGGGVAPSWHIVFIYFLPSQPWSRALRLARTAQEQDEVPLAWFVQCTALSHTHTHTHPEEFIGGDEVNGLRKREKQSEMVQLVGLELMLQFQVDVVCLPFSAFDWDPRPQTLSLTRSLLLINSQSSAGEDICATSISNHVGLIVPFAALHYSCSSAYRCGHIWII